MTRTLDEPGIKRMARNLSRSLGESYGNNILGSEPRLWYNPYKLTSLWEIMQQFNPMSWVHFYRFLDSAAHIAAGNPDSPFIQDQNILMHALRSSHQSCIALGLTTSAITITKLIKVLQRAIEQDRIITVGEVKDFVAEFQGRFDDETRGKVFFALMPTNNTLYEEPFRGWEQVIDKFPSTSFDIEEASKCFALNRYTASVLHDMRILEVGLTAMKDALKAVPKSPNWNDVLIAIEEAIINISKGGTLMSKDEKQFYTEAARHFFFVKDGLRNPATHKVSSRFDKERAERILEHVKELMTHLATRLSEVTPPSP